MTPDITTAKVLDDGNDIFPGFDAHCIHCNFTLVSVGIVDVFFLEVFKVLISFFFL